MGLILPSGTGTETRNKLETIQIRKEESCLGPAPTRGAAIITLPPLYLMYVFGKLTAFCRKATVSSRQSGLLSSTADVAEVTEIPAGVSLL